MGNRVNTTLLPLVRLHVQTSGTSRLIISSSASGNSTINSSGCAILSLNNGSRSEENLRQEKERKN
jgi:hypothetical protein